MLAFLSFLPSFPNLSFHPLLPFFPCLSLPFLASPCLSLPFLSYLIQFLSILTFSATVPTGPYRPTPYTSYYLIPPQQHQQQQGQWETDLCMHQKQKKEEKKTNQDKNKEVSYRHDYEESEYQDAPHGIYYCAQWRSWGTKST